MNKRLLMATGVYILSIAFFLGFMYYVLWTIGFSKEIYWVTVSVLLIFAWILGYIFITSLLAPKEQLDENLSQLSSEILHELNIPLSTIRANSTMLAKSLSDEKSLKRIERIDASSQRLERLYKELVYSIKKEFQPIKKETFCVKELIEERVAVFEAFERNTFYLVLEPYKMTADKIGFEKMIDNLLVNAMKYSSKDSPVTVVLKEKRLSISDEGIGMTEMQLLRVYERYYQGDSSKEGEGIGLTLVKRYCDEENIAIQIKSQKDVGTSVYLTLN